MSEAPDIYDLRELERRLAEDEATTELGVQLVRAGAHVVVRGRVSSSQARQRVLATVGQACPGVQVIDELSCEETTLSGGPAEPEDIS